MIALALLAAGLAAQVAPPAEAEAGAAPAAAPAAAPEAPEASPFGDTFKIKVAVGDLQNGGLPQELHQALSATVPETIDALGPFRALSTRDVVKMLEYRASAQALGCGDPGCMSELGDALGADLVVAGSFTMSGPVVVIQLQLLDPRSGKVEARVVREQGAEGAALFEAVRAAAKGLMAPILGQHQGELQVYASEESATVRVDGSIVGVSPVSDPLTLPAGSHEVVLEKDGFVRFAQDLMILEDRATQLDARLIPSAEYIQAYEQTAFRWRLLAYGSLALGAALAGTGAGLWAVAAGDAGRLRADVEAYNAAELHPAAEYDRLRERNRDIAVMEGLALTALGLGAAAVGTGFSLWALGPQPGRYDALAGPKASLVLSPFGLALTGLW